MMKEEKMKTKRWKKNKMKISSQKMLIKLNQKNHNKIIMLMNLMTKKCQHHNFFLVTKESKRSQKKPKKMDNEISMTNLIRHQKFLYHFEE